MHTCSFSFAWLCWQGRSYIYGERRAALAKGHAVPHGAGHNVCSSLQQGLWGSTEEKASWACSASPISKCYLPVTGVFLKTTRNNQYLPSSSESSLYQCQVCVPSTVEESSTQHFLWVVSLAKEHGKHKSNGNRTNTFNEERPSSVSTAQTACTPHGQAGCTASSPIPYT